MSSDVAVPLAAAFVASILTTVGSPWIAGFQSKKAAETERARIEAAREEARRADERSLRDGKRERLRVDYVAIAWAAENFSSAAKRLMLLLAGDTPEARGQRIQEQLEDANADLGRAIVRLRLEGGTEPLVEAYRRVRGDWFQYQYEAGEADRKNDHSKVAELLQSMETDAQGIIATAHSDLDQLGKTI